MFLHTKFKKSNFPSSCANNIGNSFEIFVWQSSVFLLILIFLSDILVCFYTQNFKKVTFPSNYAHSIGHFFDTQTLKKWFPPQIDPTILSIFWTFLPDNLLSFYTQNSKIVTFPSNCAYNIGHFFDFFGCQSSVFLLIFDFFVWYTSVFLHTKFQKSHFSLKLRP